ncbi:MAG: hypothetical protein KC550_04495, partial [Nanoarchaeota archaeon]|nr:hypothetical protein [Nanoarchaeota archaeon]
MAITMDHLYSDNLRSTEMFYIIPFMFGVKSKNDAKIFWQNKGFERYKDFENESYTGIGKSKDKLSKLDYWTITYESKKNFKANFNKNKIFTRMIEILKDISNYYEQEIKTHEKYSLKEDLSDYNYNVDNFNILLQNSSKLKEVILENFKFFIDINLLNLKKLYSEDFFPKKVLAEDVNFEFNSMLKNYILTLAYEYETNNEKIILNNLKEISNKNNLNHTELGGYLDIVLDYFIKYKENYIEIPSLIFNRLNSFYDLDIKYNKNIHKDKISKKIKKKEANKENETYIKYGRKTKK